MKLSDGDRNLYYSHATVTDSYTLCPNSGHVRQTLWIPQISEDMRCPGRSFGSIVKLLTEGYTGCGVNGA